MFRVQQGDPTRVWGSGLFASEGYLGMRGYLTIVYIRMSRHMEGLGFHAR